MIANAIIYSTLDKMSCFRRLMYFALTLILSFSGFFISNTFGSPSPRPVPPFVIVQSYTVPGTSSFTVPHGVTSITIEAWGGGGRGGSKNTGTDGTGGGGGGAYSREVLSVNPGESFVIQVGAGSSSNSVDGGDSWVSVGTVGQALILAKGGKTVPNNGLIGGEGGLASEGIGSIKYSGGNGANQLNTTTSGGGGSSAGTNDNGINAINHLGGIAPSGGGNGGNGRTSPASGMAGQAPGGGGGGAVRGTSGSPAGGNGARGQVVITYTYVADAGVDQDQCENSLFYLAAPTPPVGFSASWTLISGTAYIQSPNNVETSVTVPEGTSAVIRLSVSDGITTGIDDVTLTNSTSCGFSCISPQNQNGDLENAGTADLFNLSFQGTPATLVQNNENPSGWSSYYGNYIPNTSNFTGAYYLNKTGVNGDPYSGSGFIYLAGNGFGISPFESSAHTHCGTTYRVSARIAAYSNSGTQGNSPFSFVILASGSQVQDYQVTRNITAPASSSWNNLNWQQYSFEITLPSSYYENLQILLITASNTDGIVLDDICVEEVSPGSFAKAGEDIFSCDNNFVLSANDPSTSYSGQWSVVSGNAVVSNPDSANTTALISSGNVARLRWTLTDNNPGQTIQLIDPKKEGGFENGSTFSENGWTVVNQFYNRWIIGAGGGVTSGNNAAYLSYFGGGSYGYFNTVSQTVHFYRDVIIQPDATNIELTFKWKSMGESGYDRILVYTAPVGVTPSGGVPAAPSTILSGATLVSSFNLHSSNNFQTTQIILPSSLAGTTVRLIFTWQNDAASGTQPPAVIDEISLTHQVPSCEGFDDLVIGYNTSSFTSTIDSICVGDTTIFSASGCTDGNLLWSTGQTSASIEVSPDTTTQYSVTCTPNTPSNSLLNPGFESTTDFQFWTTSGGGASITTNTNDVYEGSKATELDGTSGSSEISQPLDVIPGERYILKVWAKTTNTNKNPRIKHELYSSGWSQLLFEDMGKRVISSNYQEYTIEFIIPPGAAHLMISAVTDGGKLFIDNWSLHKYTTCVAESISEVVVHPLPSIPAVSSITQPTCIVPTGSVHLSNLPASGDWELTRNPGGITYAGRGNTFIVSGLAPDSTYQFFVTNSNGCVSPGQAEATILPIPTDPVLSGDSHACVDAQANVLPSAGGTWSSSNSGIATVGNDGLITGQTPGNVTLTFTRSVDGCDQSMLFDVYSNPTTPFVGTIIHPTCIEPTGRVMLSNLPASGNYTITRLPDIFDYSASGASYEATGLSPGMNYNFFIQDARGCTSAATANISINPIPQDPVLGGDSTVCEGITALVTPGSNGVWVSEDTLIATITNSGIVTGIVPGTINLTYTRDSDGCSSVTTFTVKENPSSPVELAVVQPSCIVPTGSVELQGLPTNTPWEIEVSPGGQTYSGSTSEYTVASLAPGTNFTFRVTDANGCISPWSLPVTILPIPSDPVLGGDSVVCVGATALVLPDSAGIWSSANHSIATVNNNGVVTGTGTGIVSLTYTRNIDGCQSTKSFEVHAIPTVPVIGVITQPTCIVPTGSVELSGLPSLGAWTLTATPGGSSFSGSGTEYTFVLNPDGNYTFTVEDQNGCISSVSAIASINPIPDDPVLSGDTLVCVDGQAVFLPSTGGTWSSLDTSKATITMGGVATGIASGTVTFLFTRNSDGCDQQISVPVFDAPGFPLIDQIIQPTCIIPTGSVTLSGLPDSGSWVITVIPGNIQSGGSGTTAGINNLSPDDVYTFSVTDFRGCVSEASSDVFIFAIPDDPIITGDTDVCIDATTQLQPSSGGTWFSNNISVATVNLSGLVTGISASDVVLTYTRDVDGCSSDTTFTVRPLPVAPGVSTITQPTCIIPFGSVELIALPESGDWVISRSPGDTLYMDSGTSAIIADLPPDETYTFYVVNQFNCLSASSADVVILPIPDDPILQGSSEICEGTQTQLDPSSGGVWTSANPSIATVTEEGLVQSVSAGEVSLSFARDEDGCVSIFLLTVHPSPATLLAAPEVCKDSTLQIINTPQTGLPAFEFLWSGPNGYTSTSQHVVRPLSYESMSGMYYVTITDARGCVGVDSMVGVVNPLASYAGSVTDVTVFNGNDGSIDLIVSSGTPPYTYLWSNGATTEDISGLQNGLYSVTITDSKSCRVISSPEFSVGHPSNCSGFRTQTQGGWGTAASGDNPGAYRDANFAGAFPDGLEIGCTNKLRLTSSEDVKNYLPCGGGTSLLPSGTLVNPSCINNVFTGQLIALTLSATFDAYDANFGSSDENLVNLRINSGPLYGYSVGQLLTHANNLIGGCGSTFTPSQLVTALTNVNENYVDGKVTGSFLHCCQINLSTTGGTICAGNSVAISASASSGISPYTYMWSDGLGSGASKTVSPSTTTTYTVTVTDAIGCSKTATVTVTVHPVPLVTLNAPAVCAGSTLTITPFINSGTPAFTHNWTGPSSYTSTASVVSRNNATVAMSGNYSVTVTDSRGCTGTSVVTATVNPNPTAPLIGTITNPLCVPPTGSVELSGLPSTGNWTISRNPPGATYTGSGTTYTVTGLAPSTTYRFRVTDQNLCTSNLSFPASIGPIPPDPVIGGNNKSCVGGTSYMDPNTGGVWTSSNPSVASITNSGVVSANNPGTTILTFTQSDNGCDNFMVYTVFANPTPPAIENVTQPTCITPTGIIELSGLPSSGFWTVTRYPGAIPYNGSGTSLIINGLPIESAYTFVVVNGDFCVSTASASAVINGMPVNPELSGPPALCTGANTNFLPNSGGTWTSSNPSLATINNAGEVTGISPGTVTFTFVRSSDGCESSIDMSVHPNPTAPLIGSVTQPTCLIPQGSVVLHGLPTDTSWTLTRFPGNVQATGNGPQYLVEGLTPGQTYTFIVRNGFVCSSSNSDDVEIENIPSDPVISGDSDICIGETGQVYPDQDGTWTSSNTSIVTISNSGLVTGIGAGLTTLTYTRSSDGCDASIPFQVRVVPNIPFIGVTTHPNCIVQTGSVVLGNLPSSGSWTITMYPGNSTVNGSGTSYTWSGLEPGGTYQFSVSNHLNCSSGISANAIINDIPLDPVISGESEVCIGNTIQLSPVSNGIWTSSDNYVATVDSNGIVTGISAGVADLIYTRTSDGCDSFMTITVLENPSSPLIAEVTQPTCSMPFGSVLLEGLPENNSWTIIRSPGNIAMQGSGPSVLVQNLPVVTTYTFLVIDAHSCSSTSSADAIVEDIPEDPILSGDEQVCVGFTASVIPNSGGTWTSSNPTIATVNVSGQVQGIAPGLVTLTYVRNSDGCDAQKNFYVYSNPPPPFLGTVTQPTCIVPFGSVLLNNLPTPGTWTILVQPGGNQISGSGSSHLVSNLTPNTNFTFTVTSNEDCSSVSTTNVYIGSIPTLPVIEGDSLVCINSTEILSPSNNGEWESSNPIIASITNGGVITGLLPGNATMTYTRSSDGCESSIDIEVLALPDAPSLTQVVQPTCYAPYGTVWLENLPTTGNWTVIRTPNNFETTSSGSGVILPNLPIDQTYQFKVEDQYGCISENSSSVIIDTIPDDPILGGNDVVCLGGSSQLTPSTGGTWVSSEPQIIDVDNNGLVTTLEAGSAILTFTRTSDGCSNSMNFYVNPNPAANITGDSVFCNGNYGVLEASGGVIFVWSTGATTSTIFVNTSGSYTVTVTNSFGCQDTAGITTTISSGLVAGIDYHGSVCVEPEKEISAEVSGGIPPYTYQWTGPGGLTGITDTMTVSQNGNYYLTVTDAAQCTATTQGFLYQAYEPLVISLNTEVCEGTSVQLQVNNGSAVAYQWGSNANNATTSSVTVVPGPPSEVYQVTVTNDLGCTAAPSIEIDVIAKPEVTLIGPSTICVGDTTLFLPSDSGMWVSTNSAVATIDQNGLVIGVATGEARFIYTQNSNSCSSDTSEIITVVDLPLATVVGPTVICESNYTQAMPNSGGTWSSANPNIALIDNEGQILGLSTGVTNFSYSSNQTGCSSMPTQNVTITESMTLTIRGPIETCVGNLIFLIPNVQGGEWISSDTTIATINNSGIVEAVNPGSVIFTYTFLTENCIFFTNHNVLVHANPIVQFVGETDVCEGESTSLTPTTGGIWSSSNPEVAAISPDGYVNTFQAGGATFSFMDEVTGCQSGPSQTLQVNALPFAELTGQAIICVGTTTTVTPAENGSWVSSNPAVAQVNNQGVVTGLAEGLTSLTFTDTSGCSNISPIEIQVNSNPTVTFDYHGSICLTDNSELSADVSGGTPGYFYTWTGPNGFSANAENVFINLHGEYFVTVTDNAGCQGTSSGIVEERFEPLITGFMNAVCEGESETLTVQATMASSFVWSANAGASTNATVQVTPQVPASTYVVTVTNNLGCSVATQATINVHATPVAYLTGPNAICVNESTYFQPVTNGTWVSLSPTIATITNSGVVTGAATGTTRFIYTQDDTGCVSDTSEVVTVHAPTTISNSGPNELCIGQNTQLQPSSGGTWFSSQPGVASVSTSGLVNALSHGVSMFSFVNTNGCTSSSSLPITVHHTPDVVLNGDDQICEGTTTHFLPSTGGTWFSLSPSIASINSTGTVTGISEGLARFLFTDSVTGCTSDTSVAVTVNDSVDIVIVGPNEICVGNNTQLSPSSNGLWISNMPGIASISPSGIVTGLQAGQVTFTFISNNAQCYSGTSMPVTVHANPTVSLNGPGSICIGDTTTVIASSANGIWASNNMNIAQVNNVGQVVGINAGSTQFIFTDTITGCVSSPTQYIAVHARPEVFITGLTTICENGSTSLSPSSGGNWISTNSNVATASTSGVVTGISEGAVQFIFVESGSGCQSDPTNTITVEGEPVISYTGAQIICVGDTTFLSPGSNGSWVSLQPSVAQIDDSGLVTGVSNGLARFVFTNQNGCVSNPSEWLTVQDNPQITLTGNSQICVGSTTQFAPSSGGSWNSTNVNIATIDNNGMLTGIDDGNVRAIYTDSITGCSSEMSPLLTIHESPTVSILGRSAICVGETTQLLPSSGGLWISLNPSIADVNAGGLVNGITGGVVGFRFTDQTSGCEVEFLNQMTVHASPILSLNGPQVICAGETTNILPDSGGTWTSLNPTIATTDQSGLVTGWTAGVAQFRFTDSSTGCVSSSPLQVTVTSRPEIILDGPSVICIGSNTQLLPASGGSWTSTNPSVATISQTGLVTAVMSGLVQFYFTSDDTGCVSSLSPEISIHPDAMLSLSGPADICIGYTTQLTASLPGVWYAEDEAKAGISNTGLVTGNAPSTANFYFIDSEAGCVTEFTRDAIVVHPCFDPDVNVTFISTYVSGNLGTNDEVFGTPIYQNNPVLVSKPSGAFATLTVQSDGSYTFLANIPGQYRYLVPVCLNGVTINCPTIPLTIHISDPNILDHSLIVNTDLVSTYKNGTASISTLINDNCINSLGCFIDPSLVNIATSPAHGLGSIQPSGVITYTPNAGFIGTDTLVYRVCDNENMNQCQLGRVVIIVKDSSAAVSLSATDDFYVMSKNQSLDSLSILDNDSSPENTPFTTTIAGSELNPVVGDHGTYYITGDGLLFFNPEPNYYGPVDIEYEICDSTGYCVKATAHILVMDHLKIKIRAYLEGGLTENGDQRGPDNRPLMRDGLRFNVHTNESSIPALDPYSYPMESFDITENYKHVGLGGLPANRNIPNPAQVFAVTGANAIVDWVFVELRNPEDSTRIIATRSGLIQRDGDVVDLDGVSDLGFPGIRLDSCYIVLRHRNHLDVMSEKVPTFILMDFTKINAPVFDFGTTLQDGLDYTGTALKQDVVPGYMAMWAGDFDCNGKLKFVNPNDDQNLLFFEVLSHSNNVGFVANYNFGFGYFQGDVDMNGKVKYDNPDDDKNYLFYQILFHPLNANFISNFNGIFQQVPPGEE